MAVYSQRRKTRHGEPGRTEGPLVPNGGIATEALYHIRYGGRWSTRDRQVLPPSSLSLSSSPLALPSRPVAASASGRAQRSGGFMAVRCHNKGERGGDRGRNSRVSTPEGDRRPPPTRSGLHSRGVPLSSYLLFSFCHPWLTGIAQGGVTVVAAWGEGQFR